MIFAYVSALFPDPFYAGEAEPRVHLNLLQNLLILIADLQQQQTAAEHTQLLSGQSLQRFSVLQLPEKILPSL